MPVSVIRPWGVMEHSEDPCMSDMDYEKELFELVMDHKWDKENLVCFDLGANEGLWACFLATFRPGTTVFAFEPHITNFGYLSGNVVKLGLGNVFCNCSALGNESSIKKLYSNQGPGLGDSSLVQHCGGISREVPVQKLEKFILPVPDFIKMDVEYHEFEVLLGMADLLRDNPVRLLVEVHHGSKEKVHALLSSFGYVIEEKPQNIPHRGHFGLSFWCSKL